MELTKLASLLEERLVQHDNNRKEVQASLSTIYNRASEEAKFLEDKVGGEIRKEFDSTEEKVLGIIGALNNAKGGEELDPLVKQARE